MKKIIIVTLSIILAAGIAFIGYGYVSFYGIPWKKNTVARELEKHVESKYNIHVEVVEKYYNFKDGSYGAEYKVNGEHGEFTFNSDKLRDGKYLDYYVEALWKSQLKKEVEPMIKYSFASLPIESYECFYIYGIAADLKIKSDNIPDYKKVNSQLDLVLQLQDYWSEETKEKGINETYRFIQELKRNGIDNIGLRIYFKERAEKLEKGSFYGISFEAGDLKRGITQEDIKKHLFEF